jgi:hypothetical protein
MIVDLVSFDVAGLIPQPAPPGDRIWVSEQGLFVRLTTDACRPVFPATAAGEAASRNDWRLTCAEAGAGMVELTYERVDGCQAVRAITKFAIDPTTGRGRRYLGVLQIPAAESVVVLKVQCDETGITGFRETVVIQRLLASGAVTIEMSPPDEETGARWAANTPGWHVDPHDPTPEHLALNMSDDRQFDAEFPHHPLSIVRSFLDRAQRSMSLAPELKSGEVSSDRSKTWWRVW